MRVNVDIDDTLMEHAMAATGQKTKRATVEAALRVLIQARDPEYLEILLKTIRDDIDRDSPDAT